MGVRDTSVICYRELLDLGKVSSRCAAVYEFLRDNPDLTDTEIAREMGFVDPNKIRPRRKDLYDVGLVVESGKRKCGFTKKSCYTWEVKDSVPRRNFFDRKEVVVGEFVERVFKSVSLSQLIILVHLFLDKYKGRRYDPKLLSADFSRGVYVVRVVRNKLEDDKGE